MFRDDDADARLLLAELLGADFDRGADDCLGCTARDDDAFGCEGREYDCLGCVGRV